MTERLKILYGLIGNGELFADVGCDHGYIACEVLKNGNYDRVIISDISKKSLEKAENLLKNYQDRVTSIVCDGFSGYTEIPNEAIISGMGGEEIISILSQNIKPNKLVLAPQKNTDKVREFLINSGYKILKDFTFYSQGKYYDAIKCEKGNDNYTQKELFFGRDNLLLRPKAFVDKLKVEENLLQSALKNASTSNAEEISSRLAKIRSVLYENK